MDILTNRMRAEAMRSRGLFNGTRAGIVSGYDPKAYAATVTIMPEGGDPDLTPGDADTGWLPISTIWSGPGWGVFCPPTVGDQVVIEHVEGDIGSGIIVGRVFDASHLPASVESGEFWLVHQSGTMIKLTNDTNAQISVVGNLSLVTGAQPLAEGSEPNSSATFSVSATGAISLTSSKGPVTLTDKAGSTATLDGTGTATISASTINLGGEDLHKLVTDAFVEFFNTHAHPANGAPPSQPMTSAQLTSIVNAG